MVTIKKVLYRLKKSKSLIIAGIFLAIVGTVLSTVALWQTENIFSNFFETAEYKTSVTETFESPKNWKPGDETPKTVVVKNEGNGCVRARASYAEEWKDRTGKALPLENDGKRAAIINFDNTEDWVKRGNYYYYQKDLKKNETSSSFIKSVTYNKELSSDYACSTEGNVQKCTMSNGEYNGAEYTLIVTLEMVQCNGVNELWPALNYNTVLYNDGTLIINEKISDRQSNILEHGTVVKEYEPFGVNDYVFKSSNDQLWKGERNQIKNVEVGQRISPTSTAYWFNDTTQMERGDFTNLDTSNVTDMSYMFYYSGRNATTWNIRGLSNWDTSNVTDMSYMFYYTGRNATTWNIGDLSNWDTSNVTSMSYMFYFAGRNATTWNSIGTLKVYRAGLTGMFYNCSNAKATLNIYRNPTPNYILAFRASATTSGSGITVNYSSATTNIDDIIATKSENSNVVKGTLITE